MLKDIIERNYRLWMATAYFGALLLQTPLLVQHMPNYTGVETSFNTYTPAVVMMIIGCLLFMADRLQPNTGQRFKLQLFSAMLLAIGSTVWCICGVSWSSRLCDALFASNRLQRDECWGSTFLNFFSITCMMFYLAMSVVDDLFQPRARLSMIIMVNLVALAHVILYLVVNSNGPHEMTDSLKFYYYFLIIYIASTIGISVVSICSGRNQFMNNSSMVSFTLTCVTLVSAAVCAFLILYGAINYWLTQKLNAGDGAAFVGYTIFYSTANIWIMIELHFYQQHRLQQQALLNKDGKMYRYDAISQDDEDNKDNVQQNVLKHTILMPAIKS